MDYIYTVTMMKNSGDVSKMVDSLWCAGWFPTEEDARNVVLNNGCDIFECGYYTMAVIEKVPPGQYAIGTREMIWYHRNEAGEVAEVSKPKELCNMVHFGIG